MSEEVICFNDTSEGEFSNEDNFQRYRSPNIPAKLFLEYNGYASHQPESLRQNLTEGRPNSQQQVAKGP